MQKDISLKQLTEHNDVFAEIYNVLVCGGTPVVREEELCPYPTEAYTEDEDSTLHENRRDVVKVDRHGGRYRLIYDLENQDGIDNTMPERIMGYDYAAYEKQIREIEAENNKNERPAYTKRIHDDQKLAPVFTVVLYWGTKKWVTPRGLHDMLAFPDERGDLVKELVPDYPVKIISMAHLSQAVREQLHTDLRLLAEYMACRKDPKKIEAFENDSIHKIRHPRELLMALSALSKDKRYLNLRNQLKYNSEEGEVTMCEILQRAIDKGVAKGRTETLKEGIRAILDLCHEFDLTHERIVAKVMSAFHISREEAEQYMAQC